MNSLNNAFNQFGGQGNANRGRGRGHGNGPNNQPPLLVRQHAVNVNVEVDAFWREFNKLTSNEKMKICDFINETIQKKAIDNLIEDQSEDHENIIEALEETK